MGMTPLSFIEKIQMVGNLIMSSPLYLIALLVILFLLYLFITTNGSNKKESKKAYMLIYLSACVFFAFQYGSSFASLVDYTVNQIFITYYFPNILTYLLILIMTNIVLWKTIFSDTIAKPIKVINSCVFVTIIYLFILVLSLISELKLDVFNLEELYSSSQVRSIMELSMLVFTIWAMVLTVYYIIRKYQQKKKIMAIEEVSDYTIINHKNKETYLVEESKEHESKMPTPVTPMVESKSEPPKQQDLFTLDEYRVLLKLLKEEQSRQAKEPLSELNKMYNHIKM